MKINKAAVKSEWFTLQKGVKIEIRPFAFSAVKISDFDGIMLEQFMFSVLDWKGIVDENDEPLPCNDENKKFMFDYVPEVRDFVSEKIREQVEKINAELKN